MNTRNTNLRSSAALLAASMVMITIASKEMTADTGFCGGQSITLPFTDVPASNPFFCVIAEAFFSGLANGTTPDTYSPSASVPRQQMAAFVTRTLDQSLKRGSRQATLNQFWNTQGANNLALTTLGGSPLQVKSDGADLWASASNTVVRVRASDGKLLETWTGATNAHAVLVARGKVFVTGQTSPGSLYQIDPTQPAGIVTTLSNTLPTRPQAITYDGQRIWTANFGSGLAGTGSVSIISLNPFSVTTVSTGFSNPAGILFDGSNIWVADSGDDTLKKVGPTGNVLLSVIVGESPTLPAFDGINIWVPNFSSDTVSVVRAVGSLAGTVLATLNNNDLSPIAAAFDGERILITNESDGVTLWKASDLTLIGSFSTGANTTPIGACSDGLNFWIALLSANKLARF